jgi:sugar diacid utilization regulator
LHSDVALRVQLSRLQALLALSMVMTDSDDEARIIQLATSSVPSLGRAWLVGVYRLEGGWRGPGGPGARAEVEGLLTDIPALGGAVEVTAGAWGWAYPLRSLEVQIGFLVVAADEEPPEDEQYTLRVLAQQTGVALVSADLHDRQRVIAAELRAANTALERSAAIHARLTAVAVSGEGQEGIARALHKLTGYAVAVEDRHGNLQAWAGPDRPEPYRKDAPGPRAEAIAAATRSGGAVRLGDRLMIVANPRPESVAVLALIDPGGTAGPQEHVALEHGATVLAVELARLHSVEEAELRVGRDLVEELLVEHPDEQRVRIRAQMLGYDFQRPHRVVVVDCENAGSEDAQFHAVRRAARDTDVGTLVVARHGKVVVLASTDRPWERFRAAVMNELDGGGCRIGIGGLCHTPAEFARSHREAELALRIQARSHVQERAVEFDELGVFQLLAEAERPATVTRFIHRWLGPLLDYDAEHDAELVLTLASYLDRGGNYDATASALTVHRSTLRYRLQRIREITGLDLGDADVRFNLQLASRAWQTLAALDEKPDRKS